MHRLTGWSNYQDQENCQWCQKDHEGYKWLCWTLFRFETFVHCHYKTQKNSYHLWLKSGLQENNWKNVVKSRNHSNRNKVTNWIRINELQSRFEYQHFQKSGPGHWSKWMEKTRFENVCKGLLWTSYEMFRKKWKSITL